MSLLERDHPYWLLRIGKTSILKVFLNESNLPYIYIDSRLFEEEGFRRDVLYKILFEGLSKLRSRWISILKYIETVEGLEISMATIRFNWKKKPPTILGILAKLDEWASDNGRIVIVAVDEAQLLRYLRGRQGEGRLHKNSILLLR
jgi:AAA+ ATPase superfamily predicted ATPase